LGSDFPERIFLKGMIHELGHGFGLPHIGPLERDKAGNTLMGPTHVNYRRVMGKDEDRVFLSEAEAAMFASHPAFRGLSDDREELPMVEVENMQYTAEPRKRSLMVKGRLRAAQRARYALVADEADARPGEYWTKTYVAKIAADGAFEVIVSEPAESGGTLKTWFIFESGVQTGDGKSRGRDSGISGQYTFENKKWTFK
jgi:hypothetical protein